MTGVEVANEGKWENLGAATRTGFLYILKRIAMTVLDLSLFPCLYHQGKQLYGHQGEVQSKYVKKGKDRKSLNVR